MREEHLYILVSNRLVMLALQSGLQLFYFRIESRSVGLFGTRVPRAVSIWDKCAKRREDVHCVSDELTAKCTTTSGAE
jgi:hypothetical protein